MIEKEIERQKNLIAYLRTNICNPDMVKRSIDERLATIEKLRKEIADLESSLASGPERLEEAQRRLTMLLKLREITNVDGKIRKMQELQARVQAERTALHKKLDEVRSTISKLSSEETSPSLERRLLGLRKRERELVNQLNG